MRYFKVKSLYVKGAGKNIFTVGNIVAENKFPAGTADDLVKRKFIEEVESEQEQITDVATYSEFTEEEKLFELQKQKSEAQGEQDNTPPPPSGEKKDTDVEIPDRISKERPILTDTGERPERITIDTPIDKIKALLFSAGITPKGTESKVELLEMYQKSLQ